MRPHSRITFGGGVIDWERLSYPLRMKDITRSEFRYGFSCPSFFSILCHTENLPLFDSALAKARAATNIKIRAEWYEHAVDLYRGEYLQNLYYEWVFPERRRLMQSYLGALQELVSFHLVNQSPKQAVVCIEKAIPLDQLNEDLYCQGMRAYAALNDRTNLSRLFTDLNTLLETELNSKPLPETARLYQELIGGV